MAHLTQLKSWYLILFLCFFLTSFEKSDHGEETPNLQESCNTPKLVPTTVDVYLILGQSNANGSGTLATIGSYDSSIVEPFKKVLYVARHATQYWSQNVVLVPWGDLRARNPSNNGFGCELSFGKRLFYNKPDYKNQDKKMAVIKSGVGSTTLLPSTTNHSWDVWLSDLSIDYINARLDYLTNNGYTTINIKGIVWIQGESDVYKHPHLLNQYTTYLEAMMNKIKTNIPGTQNLEIVVVGLNPSAPAWASDSTKLANALFFNQQISTFANSKADYHYVSSNGLDMLPGNNPHYDGAGLIKLGYKVANVFL